MNLIVGTEFVFNINQKNNIVSINDTRGYEFWERYLDVYEKVIIVGRLSKQIISNGYEVENKNVKLYELPNYNGPLQYIKKYMEIKRNINGLIKRENNAAIISRVPSGIGNILISCAKNNKRPFGLEVVGDPYELFSSGAYQHPIRKIIQITSKFKLYRQCRQAITISYVTESTLQKKYPPNPLSYTTSYSSVELLDEYIKNKPKLYISTNKISIVTVGTMQQMYKGFDVLIKAISILKKSKYNINLTIIGDGRYKKYLKSIVVEENIKESIKFKGLIQDKEELLECIRSHDIFVLPSRQEGLPRAMIEAMSQGLPCIGTNVGGIPELIDNSLVIKKDDSYSLSNKIIELYNKPNLMNEQSKLNIENSRYYAKSKIQKKRYWHYKKLKEITSKIINKKL